MDAPVTQLDERFSDPHTDATSWAQAREVLEGAQISWISTVRADGRPHVTPLVAVWLDGRIHFATGATEQKGVNLATNPHVVLTTGCNAWDSSLDVMVEGEARRVTDRATLDRLAAAWATKWDGSWRFEVTDEGFGNTGASAQALVYAVEPTRVLAFGRRRLAEPGEDTMLARVAFTHTRHLPPRD
ncbi:MAG TPA: pyridoxamine 5'-phosphate oxidase family protein [Mycobacteriales bacterium]|jgi:general stress protein 26